MAFNIQAMPEDYTPQNFKGEIIKRFMSDEEFQNFAERYRDSRLSLGRRGIPDEYFTWLEERLSGMGVAEIARKHGQKQNRVHNGIKSAALNRLMNEE